MPSDMSERVRVAGRRVTCLPICLLGLCLSFQAARAQEQLLPVTVELGDVSLTKLPFVMAAEAGIYQRNGLYPMQRPYVVGSEADLIDMSSKKRSPDATA